MYPINSVGFNPRNDGWFMTAGSNGEIIEWDYSCRNSIRKLNYGNMPITSASVSPNGMMIAYATGNDWHLGADGDDKWMNRIGVHFVT